MQEAQPLSMELILRERNDWQVAVFPAGDDVFMGVILPMEVEAGAVQFMVVTDSHVNYERYSDCPWFPLVFKPTVAEAWAGIAEKVKCVTEENLEPWLRVVEFHAHQIENDSDVMLNHDFAQAVEDLEDF